MTCLSVSLVSKLSLVDLPVFLRSVLPGPHCSGLCELDVGNVSVSLCLVYMTCLSVSDLSVSQICPALNHAALVHVNAMLETIPVRSEVDQFIGIDYSLIDDPVLTPQSLDMHFRVRLRFHDTL